MKVFSVEQLYAADKITVEKNEITFLDLMERAGEQIFYWLHQRMQGAQVPIHIFCGIGNNAGDGLVIGRLLIESGYNVKVYIANFTDKRSKCFLINYDRIKNVTKDWPLLMTSEDDFPQIHPDDIIIDALFGIGLNRPPEGWVKNLILYLNQQSAFKLAVDIPSGLYANRPLDDPDAVLIANHTLAFQTPKLSFFLPETGKYVPYFESIDIGLDPEYLTVTEPLAEVILKPQAKLFYKQREKFAHKGDFGHALIIGGSYGKIGATVLAGKAAFRIGAGLVSIYGPRCGNNIVQTALPEAMTISDAEEYFVSSIQYDIEPRAIGVGVGLGTLPETAEGLKKLFLKVKQPLVIDADGINAIAKDKELLKILPKQSILTPHPGELKRLIGDWKNDYDKLEKVKKFSKKHEVIVVIKGGNTLTVFGDKLFINSTGNPGMATAGSGDVLTGVITGLLAQGYDVLSATIFGVYLHGSAGNIASQTIGFEAMMASDILDNLGNAYLELFRQEEPPKEEQE